MRWLNAIAVPLLGIIAAITLLDEYGLHKVGEQLSHATAAKVLVLTRILIALFLVRVAVSFLLSLNPLGHLRTALFDVIFSLGIIILGLAFSSAKDPSVWQLFIAILKIYVLVRAAAFVIKWPVSRLTFRPPLMLITSYIFIIAIGAVLLSLPRATTAGGNLNFTDAVFTSASATCVTGLIIHDTGTHFSMFGQSVILLLIQIGGLGLMTFVAFFTMFLGKTMHMRQELIMKDVLNFQALGKIPRVILFILASTFIIEIIGAIALLIFAHNPDPGRFSGASWFYYCLFHSISAFCNAGFSLNADSFVCERMYWMPNLIMIALIIIGGLGFAVNHNLLKARSLLRRKRPEPGEPFEIFRLTVQTKMVLLMSAVLIVLGFVILLAFEWNHAFKDFSASEKFSSALFQSVTPRTAGFNTVETSELSHSSQFVTIMLMFIGAAPGSTGGGVKVSTFFMFLLLLWTLIRGRGNVEVFKRNIPRKIVENALLILVSMASLILVFLLALTFVEHGKHEFLDLLFETVSAFGTVGLSTGVTPKLTELGRYVIILAMFIGRIGPLTIVLALARAALRKEYEYPTETVMIG
jgi:trk system potassium uptake protein TrkH